MSTIRTGAADYLRKQDRLDLAGKLCWDVVGDLERYDCVATKVVREDFTKWALKHGVPSRKPRPGQPCVYLLGGRALEYCDYTAARFHYCVMMNQRSLEPVRREGGTNRYKWLILAIVFKNWLPIWYSEVLRGDSYKDVTDNLPLIERNPDEDVGWFYCSVSGLVEYYNRLCYINAWGSAGLPCRPPETYDWDVWEGKWKGGYLEGYKRRRIKGSLQSEDVKTGS